ncbi:MAG: 4-hydroxy-3-methylbut-2-enyl diphosphate reductase [Bacilli bacterium]|nr:4-hydroxy-3-methylbut-2-enyl diphosphate reductase [Bacilli bacterium]
MDVKILEPRGYCAGVNNAILIAIKAKHEHPHQDVYVLGMLVHNNQVVQNLQDKGIITAYDIDEIPDGSIIVFTAHGHDKKLDEIAKNKHLIIYDAICPKVRSNILLMEKEISQGHQIIYIGLSNHPETIGAISTSKDVILYDVKTGVDYSLIKDESPLVINQTTLNVLELEDIQKDILAHLPKARVSNEICSSTRRRQQAIKELNEDEVDLFIIVGDKKSSNSTRLFEVARQSHPNVESVMISSLIDLPQEILKNKKHIVISSGASVPNETIDAIYNYLINN